MKLSIVIVNWNTCDLLNNCLQSIFNPPLDLDFRTIVVDNASNDGSQKMVEERFPEVELISNSNNPGFAYANNQALKKCSSEMVLLLNADTVVKPGSIETMVEYIENNPKVGIVGARLLNPDGSLQVSAYPEPTLTREFWRLFHLDKLWYYGTYPMDNWNHNEPRKVDVLKGACMLIRMEALEDVGMFDEDYFIYSEEVDLCARMQDSGWSLYWLPTAKITHIGGQSTQQVAEEMFLQLYQGKIQYFRKHNSSLVAILYKLIILLASLGRISLTPIAYLERPDLRQYHLHLSSNYRRLLWALPEL